MAKKSSPIVSSTTSPALTAVADFQVSAVSIADSTQSALPIAGNLTPTKALAAVSPPVPPPVVRDAESTAPSAEVPASANSPLTAQERKRLAVCEARIAAGLQCYYELGRVMREVRDARLYRETHTSIEAYAFERWEISRPSLYEFIDAANVGDNLAGVADVLPLFKSQTRPLAPLAADDQRAVWKHVVDTAGTAPITAKAIKAVISEMFPSNEEDINSEPLFTCKSLSELPKKMAKLLIVSDIITDNPAVAADKLRDVLAHAALTWASHCHLLVVSRCPDSRALKAVIEEYSFELGISLVWEQPTIRRPLNWSFGRSEIEILHARCGQATVSEDLANLIDCGEGDQGEELPFALAQLLIKATTKPGDLVTTAGGMKTMQLAAEALGRALLSIRPEADDHVGVAA